MSLNIHIYIKEVAERFGQNFGRVCFSFNLILMHLFNSLILEEFQSFPRKAMAVAGLLLYYLFEIPENVAMS